MKIPTVQMRKERQEAQKLADGKKMADKHEIEDEIIKIEENVFSGEKTELWIYTNMIYIKI